MKVAAIKTSLVRPGSEDLLSFLDNYLRELTDSSVLAITSKVAAICEGRTVPIGEIDKQELAIRESDYYLPDYMSKYGFTFTISHRTLIPNAGIDESNGDGHYILWPIDPQKTVNEVRAYLKKRFGHKNIVFFLSDSTARPLHYGTEGVGIAYSGFAPNNNYVGMPDLFGRELKVSISNILDALASAAVVLMGEGTEQTPLAAIEDVPFVNFQDDDPTQQELDKFFISHMEDDLFEPFLRKPHWERGGRSLPEEN